MRNPFLVGDKVYLRPLERDDAPTLVPWINDSDVTRTLLAYRPMNLQNEEDFIDSLYKSHNDEMVVGIAIKQTDQLIGVTGFHRADQRNRHTSFGIMIGEKTQWNKGYGTEATALMVKYAFETLNLNRVWLHVYDRNQRAVKAYEKVGFKKEGVLRQDNYREGRYWDTITMGILREEWESSRKK